MTLRKIQTNKKSKELVSSIIWITLIVIVILRIVIQLSLQAWSFYWSETSGIVNQDYKYVYSVADKEYENYIIEYKPHIVGNQLVDDKDNFLPGTELTVYYCPNFPKISVLNRGLKFIRLLPWLIVAAVIVLIWILVSVYFSSSKDLNAVLKKEGFRIIENKSVFFGDYKIKSCSDDFSNFSFMQRSIGDAGFVRYPSVACEVDHRIIELTRSVPNHIFTFEIETPWTLIFQPKRKIMLGKDKETSKKTELLLAEELNKMYIGKRLNKDILKDVDYIIKEFKFKENPYFEFDNKELNDFFAIKVGSPRVRDVLKQTNNSRILDNLKDIDKYIRDIAITDKIKFELKIKNLSKLAKFFSHILSRIISFAKEFEHELWKKQPQYKTENEFVSMNVSFECSECGNEIPINGPLTNYICSKCKTENKLTEGYQLYNILVFPHDNFKRKKGNVVKYDNPLELKKFYWEAKQPVCHKCKKPLPEELLIKLDKEEFNEFECPDCKAINISFPMPERIKDLSSDIVFFLNVAHENKEKINVVSNDKPAEWFICYSIIKE
ncbi:MAG: hypothetical protein JXL97_18560 [Bacteroidales bacterium]|nr:hypothetical protein [Bacteroidales bacterium]